MTYEESAALMVDAVFRGRIKVACLQFATFILGESPATVGHNTRFKWAQSAAQSPDQAAAMIQPMTVMDAQVQLDGAAITDAALQSTVEAVLNKLM
jgi:hypothetical protein